MKGWSSGQGYSKSNIFINCSSNRKKTSDCCRWKMGWRWNMGCQRLHIWNSWSTSIFGKKLAQPYLDFYFFLDYMNSNIKWWFIYLTGLMRIFIVVASQPPSKLSHVWQSKRHTSNKYKLWRYDTIIWPWKANVHIAVWFRRWW